MTITDLWTEFRDRLTVSVSSQADPEAPSDVLLTFTVTNQSDPGPRGPDIVFTGVTLSVLQGYDKADVPLGTLARRETAMHEHRVAYADMPDLEWSVRADVSPEAFFRFQWAGKLGGRPTVSPAVYLAKVERLDVLPWVASVLESVEVPNDDWTLGQLEAVAARIGTARAEAQATGKRIEVLAGLVATGNESGRRLIADHRKAIGDYLLEIGSSLARIEASLRGRHPSKEVPAAVHGAGTRLDQQAQKVEQAASSLREVSG